MSETCKTCRFWVHGYRAGKGTTEPRQWIKLNQDGDCRIRSVANFPRRMETDWCGEHQSIESGDKENG